MSSKTRSGRSPVRGWLEPRKISANAAVKSHQSSEAHSAKSKPIARVRPVCSTSVPRANVVTGHQSPHANAATNIHFLTSTSKPTPPRDHHQRTPDDLPRKSYSHKTSKPVAAASKSSNVVKIVNVNVINVSANDLAKLKLSNESSSSVVCSSGNDVKHKPKTVRSQPQSSQSAPRNTPKSGKTVGNKKNEPSSRRQVVVVTQKQSTVCRIVSK